MAGTGSKQITAGQGNGLPRHIAIIMDGNGRWAQKRGLPRTAGHAAGAETFRRIASYCRDLGVEYLTVYAFSTENWRRSAEEVSAIMGLLKKYLEEAIRKMRRENVRIRVLGDLTPLSPELRELIARVEAIDETLETHTQANLCVNYGGRDEIVHAVNGVAGRSLSRGAYGGGAFPLPLHRRYAGSGPGHPPQRGGEDLQLPPLAVGLRGILLHGHAVAGFYGRGHGRGDRGLPIP